MRLENHLFRVMLLEGRSASLKAVITSPSTIHMAMEYAVHMEKARMRSYIATAPL